MPDAVDVVLERADALLGYRRPDEARAVLTAAIGSAPEDARLWATLARAEWARHDPAASRTAAERALALDPDNAGALSTRIDTLLEAKDVVGAKRASDELLERRPQWAHAHLLWAWAHTRWSSAKRTATEEQVWPTSDVPRVAAALDRALELAPHDARLAADAARCFRALHWTDRSYRPRIRECLDHALELDPNDEWVMLAAGDVAAPGARAAAAARVLAQHPTSWQALRRIDDTLRNLLGTPTLVTGVFLLATVLGASDAAGGGGGVVARIVGWIVTVLTAGWMGLVETNAIRAYPRAVLRPALRRNPLVGVAFVVTGVTWSVGTVIAVVLLTGSVDAAGATGGWLVSALAVSALVQQGTSSAARLQLVRSAVRSGLWDGAVAADARRRQHDVAQAHSVTVGLAALLTWWAVAVAGPSSASWAAAAVPLLLATRCLDALVLAEVLRVPSRRRHLLVAAVLTAAAAVAAATVVVLQVVRSVTAGS